jgi:integrase/recombinase XerD
LFGITFSWLGVMACDVWCLVGDITIDRQETIMSSGGTRRRGRIIVSGPLAPFAGGLRGELAGQGYALDTVRDHVHLLADLSDWLGGRGLTAAGLTSQVAEEFLRGRRAAGHRIG